MTSFIKKYSLTFILSITVIISIILSIILWSNPSYERTHKSNPTNPRTDVSARSLASVYAPTQAIYTNPKHQQSMLIDPSVNVISEIRKQMSGYKNAHLHEISHASQSRYLRYLNRSKSIVLNYQGDVTTKILNKVVKGGLSNVPNVKLIRVVLPINTSRYIYLFQDKGYRVYRVNVSNNHASAFRKILHRNLKKIPVKIGSHNKMPLVNYPKTVRMPQYEYLLNHQARNNYILNLMNGSQHITHSTRRGKSVYTNQTNRQLLFGKYKNATYVDDSPKYKAGNYTKTLNNSYKNLMRLKLPMNSLSYFGITPRNTVTFRGFVEGFPIFNPTQFGKIDLTYRKNSLRYDFSLNSLQIPIPNERKKITLPDTRTVMNVLKAHGYKMRKVQAVDIGYHWQNAKSYKILANLIPTWFIKYNNHWLNYSEITSGQGA